MIISQAEAETFLSSSIARSTFDDNNDGSIDSSAIEQMLSISEGLFLANIRGVTPTPLVEPIDPFAKYVVLQIFHCQCIRRFPEVFRQGLSICDEVKDLLKQVRSGELQVAGQEQIVDQAGPDAYSIASRYLRDCELLP